MFYGGSKVRFCVKIASFFTLFCPIKSFFGVFGGPNDQGAVSYVQTYQLAELRDIPRSSFGDIHVFYLCGKEEEEEEETMQKQYVPSVKVT